MAIEFTKPETSVSGLGTLNKHEHIAFIVGPAHQKGVPTTSSLPSFLQETHEPLKNKNEKGTLRCNIENQGAHIWEEGSRGRVNLER